MKNKTLNLKKIFNKESSARELISSIIAIFIALIIGAIFILLMGESPIKAYGALLKGSLGSPKIFANTLSKSIPLAFTGLAVAVSFRSGMLNIGAEGQLHMGAIGSVLFALAFPNLPKIILLPLSILAGIAAGALVGSIPGYFKAKHKTSEVIVAIMLNYICTLFTAYLVNGPFKAPGTVAQTEVVPEAATLSKLMTGSQLTTALILLIAVAIGIYILLWKTSLGFKIRAVGSNASASTAAGINANRLMILTMTLSGGIAALAGITESLGKYHRFIEGFSPSFGFTGIAVAILGRNHPVGVLLTALLFGILDTGALRMSRVTSVSSNIVVVIQSIVVLLVAAPKIVKYFTKEK